MQGHYFSKPIAFVASCRLACIKLMWPTVRPNARKSSGKEVTSDVGWLK